MATKKKQDRPMSRRGRPSTADLELRKQRKKEWELQEEHRRWMESQIEEGRVEVLTAKEYFDRMDRNPNDPLDNVLIAFPPLSPAMQFLLDKVRGVPVEQFDAAMWQAMIDLHLSGVSLDGDGRTRGLIAAEMRKRTDPEFAKRCRDSAKFEVVTELLAAGEQRGETAEDVRAQLARGFGHASGESLRKWMEKHERENN
jgi:hypothetical protein